MTRSLPLATTSTTPSSARPHPESPLVVSYGGGMDSTAILVGFAAAGIVPDLIVFADTGAERPETYAALDWARRHGLEEQLKASPDNADRPHWGSKSE